MEGTDTAPQGEPAAIYQIEGDAPLSVTDAANAISTAREAALKPPAKKPDEAKPESEPPQAEADAALPNEAPGDETQAPDPVEELPSIEPPRSWTKEDKELFTTLPRETQERIAENERARERDFSLRQQEAAEQRKAAEAERARAAQVRQQYEQTIPHALAAIQAQMQGEFSDIKTWADVEKMATEDPFRYQKFDVTVKKAQALQAEASQIQQRQTWEISQRWDQFQKAEDAKFLEQAPEMADPTKAKAMRDNAARALRDVGFKDQEMAAAWQGKTGISLRDHRVQLLIRDATLWREAQAKAKQVRQAPVPPVQRPGTARPAGAANEAEISSLTKQLETATGNRAIDIAVRLQQARRGRK